MMRMEAIRRRSMMGQKNHTELSYLQSSGTQSINTGIVPNGDMKVEVVAIDVDGTTTTGGLVGSRVSASSGGLVLAYGSHQMYARYSGASVNTGVTSNVSYVDYVFDKNLVYADGVLKATFTKATFTSTYPMFLFAYNNAGAPVYGKNKVLFSKIWDSSGTLIQYLIPVIKDGVYCMYDNVSGTYYYNQGTGSFTGG